MQRALTETVGLSFRVEAQGTYLGVRIGPGADESIFWAKARLKYHGRVPHLKATPGLARERLRAYMVYASSVLHHLAQLAPVPTDLQIIEAPSVAALLAAPHVGVHPGGLGGHPPRHHAHCLPAPLVDSRGLSAAHGFAAH